VISCSDRNDIAYFFGCSSRYKGNSFFFDEELKPFVPIRNEEFIAEEKRSDSIIRHIPEVIEPKQDEEGYLLGYDLQSRMAMYGNKDILITSFDERALEVYRRAYADLDIELYDNSLPERYKKDILFLGPGIFAQRLIISGLRSDLKSDEALFVHAGENHVLRSLFHA
jgi:hypothetical protein